MDYTIFVYLFDEHFQIVATESKWMQIKSI